MAINTFKCSRAVAPNLNNTPQEKLHLCVRVCLPMFEEGICAKMYVYFLSKFIGNYSIALLNTTRCKLL